MSQPTPGSSWSGHTIGGRYKIEEMLGQGGMSSVYKATDPNLQRTVAIKLIHPHLSSDPQFVARFEREAAAVAKLRHQNIIQVFDFNHDDNVYFMVLEYVPGESLQERMQTLNIAGQKLSLSQIIDIMTKTCNAVGYAHQHGMIHRDLKPANIMLSTTGQPILMDFGVAKMLGGTQHTATGAIIGTAKYMSPEQARGGKPDERTDIYSLGVMLYELVTGEPPFDADSTVAILMKHVTEPVPDVQKLNSSVPDALVAVIKKALAKDAKDRYNNAFEMGKALSISLGGEAVDVTTLQTPADETVFSPGTASTGATTGKTAEPAKKGGIPLGAIAGIVVILLLIAAGVFILMFISGRGVGTTAQQSEASTDGAGTSGVGDNMPPELPSPESMIRIPAGSYTIGTENSGNNYAPLQEIELQEFWLDQYEVTNADYAKFLAASSQDAPEDWSNNTFPEGEEKHPIDGINWEEAQAYCISVGKRLPTEAEWEVAARGSEARLFPWGNNQAVVPLPQSGTYPTGSKPTNQSSFGVFDMAGNVWEWVDDPYAPVTPPEHQVLRGGANGFLQNMVYRLIGDPNTPTMTATAGVRCAASEVEAVEEVVLAENILATDDFTDPGSGWPILTEGTFLYGYHPPAYYHVQVNTTDDHTAVSRDPQLSDFTAETDVQVFSSALEDGAFRYGLAFRRDGENYYALTISPRAEMWYLLKSSANGLEVVDEGEITTLKGIAPPGFSPDADQVDQLRVDAKGDTFILRINGEPVTVLVDADYKAGEIGFFVENFDQTLSHIHYTVFTIREIDFDEAVVAALAQADEPAATPPPTAEAPTPTEATSSGSDALPTATEAAASPESQTTATATTASQATETATSAPQPTQTATTAATPTVSQTPTPAATNTPTSVPTPAVDISNMVLIPGGTFLMGSSDGSPEEAPVHEVTLDPYYLDMYEVSNAEYTACVAAGGCTETKTPDSYTHIGYRTDAAFANYPVIGVTWDQANAYCLFYDKRLPSEAQWEFAARGTGNLRYPWGNSFNANLTAATSPDVQAVDSFPGGVSPFGIYNMAGNVNEWVLDVFDSNFYANSPARNPVSNSVAAGRIFRGGSFGNTDGAFYTTSRRYGNIRTFADVDVGFRCAADAP